MRKIIILITSTLGIIIFVPMLGFGWISTIFGQILQFVSVLFNFAGSLLGICWEKIIYLLWQGWHFVTTTFNWLANYFVLRYVDAGFLPPIASTIFLTLLQWFAFTRKIMNKVRARLKFAFKWTKIKLAKVAQKFLHLGRNLRERANALKQSALEKFKSLL
ncbi:MAG: hypothetical protein J5809_03245 [Selenomonadaceae bacterium]|nr:hypothetical protein [Selenomonadaceae bacterium]